MATVLFNKTFGISNHLYSFNKINNHLIIGGVRLKYNYLKELKKKKNVKGILVNPGDKVMERTVIVKQKQMDYHPGINVGIDPRDKSLYAITEGTVMYSIEKFKPDFQNQFVMQYYSNFVGPLYKKYIHIIPEKPSLEFKLIDLI